MRPIRTVIFAKAPLPGLCKTRLAPVLGAQGAARLAQRMLQHTVGVASGAGVGEVELCVSPAPETAVWQPFRDPLWTADWQAQGEGDLGTRLARAAQRSAAQGRAVLLIGTDCPALDAQHLRQAAQRLQAADAVIIPSLDGGYVLLGLNRFHPSLFEGIAWSTSSVAGETMRRIRALDWSLAELPPLRDIDEPGDLHALPQAWLEGV
ncbi:MAG: TIGR04282 family arsenosugar biosynthesis glycosyltransferase [Rhodoferax sp.]